MANYYVSKDGDDSTGDGLSWETAWKTLSKAAASNVINRDTLHVGQGVYTADGLWAGINYAPEILGYGVCVFDGNGGHAISPDRGALESAGMIRNIQFRNASYAYYGSTVYGGPTFVDCRFDNCVPCRCRRYNMRLLRCVIDHGNEPASDYWTVAFDQLSVVYFQQCTFINTRLDLDSNEYLSLEDNVFYNPDVTGDYFPSARYGLVRNNCFASVDATRGLAGYTSLESFEAGESYASGNFVVASPLVDPENDVFHSVTSLSGRSTLGGTVGALPYAHVLSPNVNSAAFAAPNHTDNVEQDGDVWKLTSPGAGVLSWYQDLGNTYNVTGIDVIGTITDAGHVWDSDNSDGDLTYLIKGSASPFTPVTSAPTAGVDGWQLANHGESISLASVRYVQIWIVPRTNGVS